MSLDGVLMEGRVVSPTLSTLDLLKRVEEQEFKALVVRINSPGGTVGASQELYGALRRLSEEADVKVVVSMGDVAASGGVYIAMAADYVFVQPGTVTGSIGVLIKTGNFRSLLDKIGIQSDVIKSGKYKDILSFDRAITDDEKQLLQTITDDTYDQFVETVAIRRRLSLEDVKQFADGRILSGRQALKLGLADALGGRYEAIEKARELAQLEAPPVLVKLEKKKPLFQKVFHGASFSQSPAWLQRFEEEYRLSGIPLWLMSGFGGQRLDTAFSVADPLL